MSDEQPKKRGRDSRSKRSEGNTPATRVQGKGKDHEPNPETQALRNELYNINRMAGYSAQAIVPEDTRNRPAVVAQTRRDIAAVAAGDLIHSGKYHLPDRPQDSHAERASRAKQGTLELT